MVFPSNGLVPNIKQAIDWTNTGIYVHQQASMDQGVANPSV